MFILKLSGIQKVLWYKNKNQALIKSTDKQLSQKDENSEKCE